MFFSQLLKLNKNFSKNLINQFDWYFAGLSTSAAKVITVSKALMQINTSVEECYAFLNACSEIGFLDRKFAYRCTACEKMVSIKGNIRDFIGEKAYCIACDETMVIDKEQLQTSIEVVFCLPVS